MFHWSKTHKQIPYSPNPVTGLFSLKRKNMKKKLSRTVQKQKPQNPTQTINPVHSEPEIFYDFARKNK